ncbi:MAG TPA: HAMP domain-containing sensor histidine kinase, partial [Spirochaetia bacterium]|nr:HAMP domain-containing sensor histidine kinase [Spirochaetia bacterium]
ERLIELLFSYSTLDLEGVRPVLASVAALPFLQGVRDSFVPAFPGADIGLVEEVGPGGLRIRADVELTRRVISNLVDNAVKHGGKDPIIIQWKVRRGLASRTVEVIVSDNGVGVAAADLPRIFEPFFRADPSRTRHQEGAGAGLGLSIVAKLMQAQGGAARASSVPGAGLEITLTFPEAENGAEANPDH